MRSTLSLILNVPYFEARVTALSCQWLMGPCVVNSINLPDGSSSSSGVVFPHLPIFLCKAEIHSYKPAILDLVFSWLDALVGVRGKMQVFGGKQMCRSLYQYV